MATHENIRTLLLIIVLVTNIKKLNKSITSTKLNTVSTQSLQGLSNTLTHTWEITHTREMLSGRMEDASLSTLDWEIKCKHRAMADESEEIIT